MNKLNQILLTPVLLAAGLALITLGNSFAEEARNTLPKKQHRSSDAPFLSPEQAVDKMSIPDGFKVSVFAAEPDIAEPIAFCFDERGRVWVAENFNYQTRGKHSTEPISRIQILEDTDGDGVFDKKKTFADNLTFTSGIACGFGGVFVGSPPNLSFIPDADGDDRPDGPPQPLLDGWGMNDRHETLNSFIWGPDGWLYGCHGVFTQSRVGHVGDKDSNRQFIDGGIWRYHPIRKTFEIFARGLSNPWGFDFDDHGQSFATCCVIPHLFHIVQGGVYHKQSLPHVNPHIYEDIKTIRDHTHLSAHGGARFYLADAFPPTYRNRLFMCNIHEHAVLTDVMVPKGSSFIGKHGDDFLPTNDLAWVGFSVEIGPEGGVYILDWHDTDVCGNAINFPNSGRIYRIMPSGASASVTRNLAKMSDLELVELQQHSNDWYVRQSRTLLQARAAAGELDRVAVHAQLEKLFQAADQSPQRLRALWSLHVTEGIAQEGLVSLLSHDDPYVRAWAIQFLFDQSSINAFQMPSSGESPIFESPIVDSKTLQTLANMAKRDSSPIVRLYLASALQRIPFTDRWPLLEGLVSHDEDVSDHNLPQMIWFGLEPMVPHHPSESLQLVVNGKLPKLQEFVARRIATGEEVVTGIRSSKKSQSKGSKAKQTQSTESQQMVHRIAPGFHARDVGEGGIVYHSEFRNKTAIQTHPLDKNTPSSLRQRLQIPRDKTTRLSLRVSHHPHGDWQLRVLASGELLAETIVGPQTVGENEWLELEVDLTKFAGQSIDLNLENSPNDWNCEWAYWNRVAIISH
ncbi:hypothetical protein N9N28_02285 [Rubripirellula amarantea]|nr:hypothetical protein [Rubripirellula amarantea]